MIEVGGLSIRRSGRPVLDGYGFAVERGSVLAVLGANGVGKTTLLSCIIGTLRPDAGAVRLGGRIGFVPQLFNVAFDYTVADVALMGRARHIGLFGAPRAADYAAVREALGRLGIADLEHRPFNALSGGQRELVMIAQALGSDCEILILDEPCSSLDYRNQVVVIDMLSRLGAELGLTVVFTSHAPQHAVEIASHVLLMRDSQRYSHGPAAEVLTDVRLSELYGVPIGLARFAEHDKYTFAPLYDRPATPGAPP